MISQSVRSVNVRTFFHGLRERLRIVDDHFIGEVAEVGPREPLRQVQLIAVRMTDRVEARPAVEVDGVDDQRVAFPVADRVAEPGRDAVAVRRVRRSARR